MSGSLLTVCQPCGARFEGKDTCADAFIRCQRTEIENPAYYAVHHISVPCYKMQHGAYSARGWLEVRSLLSKFIRDGWTPEDARRRFRSDWASRHPKWSLMRGTRLPGVAELAWTGTLASVRMGNPEEYCAGVRAWAESILWDTQTLAAEYARGGGGISA